MPRSRVTLALILLIAFVVIAWVLIEVI